MSTRTRCPLVSNVSDKAVMQLISFFKKELYGCTNNMYLVNELKKPSKSPSTCIYRGRGGVVTCPGGVNGAIVDTLEGFTPSNAKSCGTISGTRLEY